MTMHPDTVAETPPPRIEAHERRRIMAAQTHAKRIYPGVVGEILSDEIAATLDMGWMNHGTRIARLVEHLMTAALPDSA